MLGSGRDVHWSPDGSEIAFLDDVPSGGQWVFVERRDGTARRQLVPANSLEAWSPDGTRLLVNLVDTRIVPVNGGNPLEIQNFGGIAWTPDGSRIIGYDSREQLESISADGTDARRIAGGASSATLSPDGRRLAFERQSDGHVVVTDLDGGVQDLGPWDAGPRDLHMQFEPRWSPDSTRIVWSGGKIIVADTDSGQTQVIAGGPGLTTDQPHWSADGSSVLDTPTDTNDNTDIYVAQPDGSQIRRVFADPLPEGGPVWSPNGKQLAFIRYGSPPSLVVTALRNGYEEGVRLEAQLDQGLQLARARSPTFPGCFKPDRLTERERAAAVHHRRARTAAAQTARGSLRRRLPDRGRQCGPARQRRVHRRAPATSLAQGAQAPGRLPGGCEGRISHLKRSYGIRRSRLRGHEGARTWVGWAILTYNLDTLTVQTT